MRRVLGLFVLAVSARAGVIQGVVLEQASGRPVARTVVRLNLVPGGTDGRTAATFTTRALRGGQFVFPAVPPGLYLLTALRDGYFPAAYGQRLPAGRGTPIQVTDDSDFFGELRLRHKGAITGRVLDENGVGTAGVPVVAYRARLPLRSAGSGLSNDRGTFRIFGLDPGKYWVRSAAATLDDGSGWLPTFGPMAREVREARTHVVTVDGETPDADVSPESGTLFRLGGLVGCDREGPVTVTLSSETGRRRTETACRAGYQFTGLAPGAYEIFATMRDTASSGFTEVYLDRDSDAGNVQLMTSPLVSFTVRMAGSKDGADMGAKVPVTITGRRQDLAESEEEREFSTGKQVPMAPGHWEFRARAPAGYYVESIAEMYGYSMSRRMYKPERVADWFEVYIEPRFGRTIRVVVSDRAGQLMGRVLTEGKPVPGAPVYLWPVAEAARRSLGGAQQLIADAGGRFRFDGLPPGDYRVVASFDLNDIDEETAEECRAQTVRVEERQAATIDLGVWTAP